MAPHPLKDRHPEKFGRRTCGTFIIPIPALAHFTGTVADTENAIQPGMIPARCWKCGKYSEYEVVAPPVQAIAS